MLMAFIEPASVRSKNPGACWPGPSSAKFGAIDAVTLTDRDSNQMAVFPDKVSGAASLFDLLGRVYVGMRVRPLLAKYMGWKTKRPDLDKNLDAYCKVVCSRTGLSESDTLTASYIRTPKTGIAFARAMAFHEAGKEYPMTAREWKQAHALAFPVPETAHKGLRIPFRIPAADGPSSALGDRIADLALTYVGKGEKPGPGNYQFMDDFYATLGIPHHEDDRTAWCKLLVSAVRKKCGAEVEDADDDDILLARHLLKLGPTVDKNSPDEWRRGDSPVWPRGNSSWQGHTGIFVEIDRDKRRVKCVEGNVSNSTVERWYTFDQIASKALGISRPIPDKRQPNGTVRYRDVVSESPSLTMQVYAWFAAGIGGIVSYWGEITGAVGGVVHALPFMADQTTSTVGAAQRITETAGLSMPAKLMFLMTFVLFATMTVRMLRERSKSGGKKPVKKRGRK